MRALVLLLCCATTLSAQKIPPKDVPPPEVSKEEAQSAYDQKEAEQKKAEEEAAKQKQAEREALEQQKATGKVDPTVLAPGVLQKPSVIIAPQTTIDPAVINAGKILPGSFGTRWDFETGTLEGWTPDGDAFGGQPVRGNTVAARRPGEAPNQHGQFWIGTYEIAGDGPQGTLTSPRFVINAPYLRFRVGGGQLSRGVGVELRTDDPDEPMLMRAGGRDDEAMQTVTWNVGPYQGREVYILVFDRSSGGWGHINVDDFELVSDAPRPEVFRNWDFEDFGIGLRDWTRTGNAFLNQPTYGENVSVERVNAAAVPLGGDYWRGPYPTGIQGRYWIGTYEYRPTPGNAWGAVQGDGPTGTLTSPEFTISQPWITLMVGGGAGPETRVELQVLGADKSGADFGAVHVASGTNSEVMRRVEWDVAAYAGRVARIHIADESSGGWGHINVDDIRFHDAPPPAAPAELWGFADTHAHPAADRGFGGMYFGNHTGPIETALAHCEPAHGIGGTGLRDVPAALRTFFEVFDLVRLVGAILTESIPVSNDTVRDLAINAVEARGGFGHLTGGYPQFDGWPHFTTKVHQHMHEEWIRRAYDGGLRLMVALAVNAELLANIRPVPGVARSDVAAYNAQIAAIKELARRNSSWMEVAYSPAEARAIIGRNKLALVIGVEVDTLGGWETERSAREGLEAELRRLHGLGVRHIFPIHLANSPFGGYSQYSDLFTFNSYILRGEFPVHAGDPEVEFRTLDFGAGGDFPGPDDEFWDRIKAALQRSNFVTLFLEDFAVDLIPLIDRMRDVARRNAALPGGHVNAQGLTPTGRLAIGRMMDYGWLVEIDHMSKIATDQTLALAAAREANGLRGYPLVSGHTTFRDLRWRKGTETSDGHKYSHEGDKSEAQVRALRELGGTVGPMTTLFDFRSWGTRVPNDNLGSSKTFAQAYLYAVEKMGGRGVALATDMAMLGGLGPRFGPWGAYGLHGDDAAARRTGAATVLAARQRQAGGQTRGVRYDTPIRDVRGFRFEGPDGLYGDEHDIWVAVLLGVSDVDIESADLGGVFLGLRVPGNAAWIKDIAKGVRAAHRGRPLDSLPVPNGIMTANAWGLYDFAVVQRAGWHGYQLSDAYVEVGRPLIVQDNAMREVAQRLYGVAGAVRNMQGPNPPLRRSRAGNHDFDFNLDGLAHYGLLPDMLQDLKNIGLTHDDLKPMFRSAEDYIRMWEKAHAMRREP